MEYATAAADGVAEAATSTVAPPAAPSRRGAKSFEAVAQAIAQPTAAHKELAELSYCTATAGPAGRAAAAAERAPRPRTRSTCSRP